MRFQIFAEFITQTFPNAHSIADIAGGRGRLSIELRLRQRKPTVIDPRRPCTMPGRIRNKIRKEARRTGVIPRFEGMTTDIETADLSVFDLIVGMHPDQATEWIVRRAVELNKPFAIVPCCVMPIDGVGRSYVQWLDYLMALAPGSQMQTLPFSGRNGVIYKSLANN